MIFFDYCFHSALLNMIDHLIDINCVNAKNGDGLTVLHTCVYRGDYIICGSHMVLWYFIHLIADDLVCVKKLLENGADPNIKNRFDNTALQIAENGTLRNEFWIRWAFHKFIYCAGNANVTAVIKAHLNNPNRTGKIYRSINLFLIRI